MPPSALPHALVRRGLLRGGLSVALALGLAAGSAFPAAAADAEAATETVYRFPFDPATTTPAGGEFASTIANGKARKSPHRGHDFSFGGASGAPIPAIADGVVRGVSGAGPLGNCVALEHPDGAFSAYCHMHAPSPLRIGSRVSIGDPVGSIGGTPKVPVHLHLSMGWSLGAMAGIGTFDPIPYIRARLAKPTLEARSAAQPEPAPPVAGMHPVRTAV